MRRLALPLLILLTVVIAATLAWLFLNGGTRRHAAPPEPVIEQRDLAPFRRIDISGVADVTLVQAETGHIDIETDSRHRVRARVEGETLVISVERGPHRGWMPFSGTSGASGARLKVAFHDLESIAAAGAVKIAADAIDVPDLKVVAAGSAKLRIDGLKADTLKLSASGAVKADLAGTVRDQSISISGAGDIHAADLVSETAKVSVSGAGKVVINAQKTLRVGLSGAGVVEYLGNPELHQSVSGMGRVKRRDGPESPAKRVLQVAIAN